MEDKILIFTSSNDKTCDYLISKYRDSNFFRFNFDYFSSYRVTTSSDGFKINSSYGNIDTNSCKSIYFRKPMHENLDNIFDKKYHHFAHREAYSLIEGITESYTGTCLSKPSIMRKAGNKVSQAMLAKKVGFTIPELLITNDLTQVNLLKEKQQIVKPLSIGTVIEENKKEFVQTNMLNPGFDLESLKYAPAYFQEYIEKDFEVRITFVGKKAFSVKIDSENKVDWRKLDNNIKYSLCEMPNSIYDKCLNFLNLCEIQFGCFDFIVKDSFWYFLEMNSNGQWAWLEFETGASISEEIVGFLNGF
jgi:glutathione synthase/RimK-type ligase-like ATP-grasp enzyme